MPRYRVDIGSVSDDRMSTALRIAVERFPEIALETGDAVTDFADRTRWMFRAPSVAHLRRWAEAAHLPVTSVHDINDVLRADTRRDG